MSDAVIEKPQSFLKNIFTMGIGTIIGQSIPLLALPILSRLYTPADYALLNIFITFATTLSLFATGRYEFAVVLAKSEKSAQTVLTLTMLLNICFSLLTMFALFIGGQLAAPYAKDWLLLLPLAIFSIALYQITTHITNRNSDFKTLSFAAVMLQAASAVFKIALGVLQWFKQGLIIGYTIGITIAAVFVYRKHKSDLRLVRKSSLRDLLASARAFKQFPLFNVPYSLVGTLGSGMVVILYTTFDHIHFAGCFALTRSLVYVPVTFLSLSLGKVYFREAASHVGGPILEEKTQALNLTICELLLPTYCFLMVWAPDLFGIIFGEAWRQAGVIASIFTPAAYFFLFSSWPGRLYEVTKTQNISFFIQLISDVVSVGVLAAMLYSGVNLYLSLIVYSLLFSSYHLVYIRFAYRAAGFHQIRVIDLLKKSSILFASIIAPMTALQWLHKPSGFIVSILILLAYYIRLIYKKERFITRFKF